MPNFLSSAYAFISPHIYIVYTSKHDDDDDDDDDDNDELFLWYGWLTKGV